MPINRVICRYRRYHRGARPHHFVYIAGILFVETGSCAEASTTSVPSDESTCLAHSSSRGSTCTDLGHERHLRDGPNGRHGAASLKYRGRDVTEASDELREEIGFRNAVD